MKSNRECVHLKRHEDTLLHSLSRTRTRETHTHKRDTHKRDTHKRERYTRETHERERHTQETHTQKTHTQERERHTHTLSHTLSLTRWKRYIGGLELQVSFRKRTTNYWAFGRK